MYNMTETVESVCAHPVLRALPAAGDVLRKYTNTRSLIHTYEETMRAVWMNQNVSQCFARFLKLSRRLAKWIFSFDWKRKTTKCCYRTKTKSKRIFKCISYEFEKISRCPWSTKHYTLVHIILPKNFLPNTCMMSLERYENNFQSQFLLFVFKDNR